MYGTCMSFFYVIDNSFLQFQLVCSGCPSLPGQPGDVPWICDHCYYKHPDPVDDPFYQSTVKSFMYYCAAILLLVKFFAPPVLNSPRTLITIIVQSYLIGLWFSLRTHASQIWQNPQQLLHPMELPTHRISLYNKLPTTAGTTQCPASLSRRDSNANTRGSNAFSQMETPLPRDSSTSTSVPPQAGRSSANRKLSYASQQQLRPVLESVDHAVKNTNLQNIQLPESMTTDDFTRAVAVATVSALRHQQQAHSHSHSPGRVRSAAEPECTGAGGHGGHDAPSWSRTTSASVLLGCTALYAVIAGMCALTVLGTYAHLSFFLQSYLWTSLMLY
jgi:Ca2+:H+ antiporter